MKQYLRIGCIVRAHGVHGAVKLQPTTDRIERFRGLSHAYLEERNGAIRPVERLRGAYLSVDRAHTVPLPADTYFVADLIGCDTFDTAGRRYGKVTDVVETGANDVYVIENGKLMVPALKRVLHEVATEEQRIVFDAKVLSEVGLFED